MKPLFCLLLLAGCILTLFSCSKSEVKLAIQNNTKKDSLYVIVRVNSKEVFNNYVKKAVSSTSVTRSEFSKPEGQVYLEVNVPNDSLVANATYKLQNLKQIIITISSVPTSLVPVVQGKSVILIENDKVSINFLEKENMELAP